MLHHYTHKLHQTILPVYPPPPHTNTKLWPLEPFFNKLKMSNFRIHEQSLQSEQFKMIQQFGAIRTNPLLSDCLLKLPMLFNLSTFLRERMMQRHSMFNLFAWLCWLIFCIIPSRLLLQISALRVHWFDKKKTDLLVTFWSVETVVGCFSLDKLYQKTSQFAVKRSAFRNIIYASRASKYLVGLFCPVWSR